MRWVLLLVAAAAAIGDTHKLKTRFTFRRPTVENVLSILFGCDVTHQIPENEVKFNHNSVGITLPIICNDADESSDESYDMFPLCSGFPLDNESKQLNKFLDQLERSSRCTTDNIECSSINYNGWRILRFRKRVGYGKRCYACVQNAIHNWDFVSHDGKKAMGIIAPTKSVHLAEFNQTQPTTVPRIGLLGTFSEIRLLNSLFVVNPIQVIYDIKDSRNIIPKSTVSSSSYATLDGHLLTGEERVSIIFREKNDAVDVEIVSFSRPAPSINGRIAWPFIGRMQKQFFLKELEHLSRVAKCK